MTFDLTMYECRCGHCFISAERCFDMRCAGCGDLMKVVVRSDEKRALKPIIETCEEIDD